MEGQQTIKEARDGPPAEGRHFWIPHVCTVRTVHLDDGYFHEQSITREITYRDSFFCARPQNQWHARTVICRFNGSATTLQAS